MKYFVKTLGKEVSITSKEYEDYIIEDAIDEGQTKTIARKVIRENREEAREVGENEFFLSYGASVIIRK